MVAVLFLWVAVLWLVCVDFGYGFCFGVLLGVCFVILLADFWVVGCTGVIVSGLVFPVLVLFVFGFPG